MGLPLTKPTSYDPSTLVKLAKEIAQDIRPLDDVLASYKLSSNQWETIQRLPTFQRYLTAELADWNSASNTQERVKLKAATVIEEALPRIDAEIHGAGALNHKIEALKVLKDLAGMGKDASIATSGEKFSITINLGEDRKLEFTKSLPPVVIEGEKASVRDDL